MSNEQKPGDPADKAADGAFGGVQNHRSGYGDDKLARLVDYLRQHPSATLASGEGALLLAEIDRLQKEFDIVRSMLEQQIPLLNRWQDENTRLRAVAKYSADHYADARAEIDRLKNELKTETETVQHLIGERTADREHWGAIEDSLDRAERILAALREPSKAMLHEMTETWIATPWGANHWQAALRAAVAAAEQEVGG